MKQTGCGQKMLGLLVCVTLGMTVMALGGHTTALAGEQRIGANLIGKIEGAEVVTDAAKFPKKFNEAPALAALVKQKKLPPVAQRLPADPLVIKPLHEVGKYGGTWRRGFTGPNDKWNHYRCCAFDTVLYVDYKGEKLVPNIAKDWKVSDGGRTFTITLRRGMKWSDGAPFTADDFLFWYEDMFLNKDLNTAQSQIMSINGKDGKLEKVDAYTLRYSFPEPYYLFLDMFAAATPIGGQAYQGHIGTGGFAPKHYLKQYLPKYAGKEALDKLVKAEGFDSWLSLLKFKNDVTLNPDLPVVTAWKTTVPANKSTWVLERNPYYYGVDTAGNQLPYIDKVVMTLAENLEVINMRAVAGEYDFQARHIDIQKLPVFVENQKRGGYKVYLDPMENGSDYGIWINPDYKTDPEIGKWLATLDFRRALALGIKRDQINEVFFLGVGVAGSAGPADGNLFNPGPEYRTRWATYDPDKANQMLDAIGLKAKDAEGYRLRTDGKGRLRLELATMGGQFVQHTKISEMVREHLRSIGIDIFIKEYERGLWGTRAASNECQLFAWGNDGTDTLFIFPFWFIPIDPTVGVGGWVSPNYGSWFASNGAKGTPPPAPMQEVMSLYKQGFSVPAEERVKLGKRMWQIALDEVWHVGVVGQAGAVMGVRLVSTKMGNIPDRQANLNTFKPPAISRPQTYYFK